MIHFEKKVLANGLVVVAEQDKSTNLCAVNVLYKVGSRNEASDKTGFAHLFEHLMFGGSKHAPDFDGPLQMASGENNAFTNNDYTNYYDLVPFENLETALWLEADRMSNLSINQETLSLQKKVVTEEFKEVCLNKPYGDSWHHLCEMAFTKHPYNWPTIGKNVAHIENANLQDVIDFYKKYYHPNNAVLSISGPLETDKVFDLVEKWFGDIEGVSNFKKQPLSQEPLQTQTKYKSVTADVPSPLFLMAYHMPGRGDKDYYACDLLTDIMANGKSARFYNRLVRKQKLLSLMDCYVTGTFDAGLIITEGRPMPEVSIDEGINAVFQEIELLKTDVPTEKELQKVKNKVISSLAMSDLNVLNKAISMSYYEALGAIDIMNRQEELYEAVTIDEIVAASEEYLRQTNLSVLKYNTSQTSNAA